MNVIIPHIAIIDPNTLAVLGLKHLLESVMPQARVDSYASFAAMSANHPERYFHFFVEVRTVLANMPFFLDNRQKTIVLVGAATEPSISDRFHTICTDQPEKLLLRSILMLEQHAHAHGRNLPPMQHTDANAHPLLSPRETEVLALIVKGLINKEIADQLNVALPTVISHRKNLMAKLGMKSVSALTIYAVMHGLVSIDDI